MSRDSALTEVPGGVRATVRVKPRASKSRVLGVREGALVVAVAAPPVDGAANAELIRTIARHFGVRKSSVEIESGRTGRTKRVAILGVDLAGALARLPA